jgi:hypothetical protein
MAISQRSVSGHQPTITSPRGPEPKGNGSGGAGFSWLKTIQICLGIAEIFVEICRYHIFVRLKI